MHSQQEPTARRTFADAPLEQEQITAETAAAFDQVRKSLAGGEGIPHSEILHEFGLSQ